MKLLEIRMQSRGTFANWIVYVSILLLGLVAGVVVVHSVRPAPAKSPLTYEMMFFASDAPVSDFSNRIRMMKSLIDTSSNGLNKVVMPATGQSAPVQARAFYSASNGSTVQTRKGPVEVHGRESNGKVVTTLTFRIGGGLAMHNLVSDAGEICAIQIFDKHQTPEKVYYYGLIRATSPNLPIGPGLQSGASSSPVAE